MRADGATLGGTTGRKCANEATAPLREQWKPLHSQPSNCLQAAERALGRPTEALDELPVPAGLPVPDVAAGVGDVVLPEPPSVCRGNDKLLRYGLRRQFRDRVESDLWAARVPCGQQLRAWTRQYVEELRNAFRTRAELCRARLEVPSAPATDAAEVEGDPRLLEGWVS